MPLPELAQNRPVPQVEPVGDQPEPGKNAVAEDAPWEAAPAVEDDWEQQQQRDQPVDRLSAEPLGARERLWKLREQPDAGADVERERRKPADRRPALDQLHR